MLQAAGAGGGEGKKKKPTKVLGVKAGGVRDSDLEPRVRRRFMGDKGVTKWSLGTRPTEKTPNVRARTHKSVLQQLDRSIPKVSNKDYKKMTPEQRSLYHQTQKQALLTWQNQYGRA